MDWGDAFSTPPSPTPIQASDAQQLMLDRRTSRLQSDTAAIVQLDQQIASIDSNILDFEKQVFLLGEVIHLSRSEREDLLRRREVIRTNIQALSRSLCPISVFTEDVLRVIFEHLASSFRFSKQPCDHAYASKFNFLAEDVESYRPQQYEGCIRASLSVASVCKTWRLAALSCPSIWSTVVLRALDTYDADIHTRQARRICCLLSRSGATPLDIFVQATVNDATPFVDIMNNLYSHIDRWRRFEYSTSNCTLPIHKYLRGPAPLLEELRVTLERGDTPPSGAWAFPQCYLDDSPRLRDVDLSFMPFALIRQSQSLLLVSRLTLILHDTIPSAVFCNMFDLPALECLDLNIPGRNLVLERPSDILELPALRHLTLRSYAAEIPARFRLAFRSRLLTHCYFYHTWPSNRPVNFVDLVGFLDHCSGSLTTVGFSDASLSADEGAMIAVALDKATAIIFVDGTLDARCIAAFSTGFSALESITTWDTVLLEDAIEKFIDFVRQKNPRQRAKEEEAQARTRLTFVRLSGWSPNLGFSERDQLEIDRLVAG